MKLKKESSSESTSIPEELHGAALIGREADDLPDEVPDELVARGVLPLGPRRLLLQCVGGRLVALVLAHHEFVPRRHSGGGQRGPFNAKFEQAGLYRPSVKSTETSPYRSRF